MQGQLAGGDAVFGGGVLEQRLEERGAFGVGNAPADDPAAEDVDDHIEIEIGPLGGPHQLADIPGPYLVWAFGDEFGLGVDGVAQLSAAFPDFVVLMQDPVHGADRAMVEALVEQAGVDLRRGLIDEPRLAQQIDDALAFVRRQRPRGLGSGTNSHRRPRRRSPASMEAGAGQPQGGAGGGDHAWLGRQGGHGVHQDSSSLTIGRPRSKATFFWMSMTASARCNRRVRRLLSRSNWACSAARGLAGARLGPRLTAFR